MPFTAQVCCMQMQTRIFWILPPGQKYPIRYSRAAQQPVSSVLVTTALQNLMMTLKISSSITDVRKRATWQKKTTSRSMTQAEMLPQEKSTGTKKDSLISQSLPLPSQELQKLYRLLLKLRLFKKIPLAGQNPTRGIFLMRSTDIYLSVLSQLLLLFLYCLCLSP